MREICTFTIILCILHICISIKINIGGDRGLFGGKKYDHDFDDEIQRFHLFDAKTGQSYPIPRSSDMTIDNRSTKYDDEGLDERLKVIGQGIKVLGAVAWFFVLKSFAKNIISAAERLLEGTSKGSNLPSHVTPLLRPNVTLNTFEIEVAHAVVDPMTIEAEVTRIGGLRDVKRALWECVSNVVLQQQQQQGASAGVGGPHVSTHTARHGSFLLKPVSGVLLFGPPGCGKTLLAKAMSKKAGLPMIHITPSLLLRKWVGDTSLLTKAVFTLAQKLSPCVLFVDEMDSLLRTRADHELSVDRNLKTEFMQLWDELIEDGSQVLVVGATNRPQDLDSAIQRRFERSFLVGLPDHKARMEVLDALLRGVALDSTFDFTAASTLTEGYSPSDMRALCKAAVAIPLKQLRRQQARLARQAASRTPPSGVTTEAAATTSTPSPAHTPAEASAEATKNAHHQVTSHEPTAEVAAPPELELRPLLLEDLEEAALTVYPTQWSAASYGEVSGNHGHSPPGTDPGAGMRPSHYDNTQGQGGGMPDSDEQWYMWDSEDYDEDDAE